MRDLFVITGAPGGGKTSIIEGLRKRGFRCLEEESRVLISELMESKSGALPWIDLLAFNELLLERQIRQYHSAPEGVSFFDRSFVDDIGYLRNSRLSPPGRLSETIERYRFNRKVFFTEPWEEIYLNDSVRKEPFSMAVTLSDHMKGAYADSGYEIIPIPKLPVDERVGFIIGELKRSGLLP